MSELPTLTKDLLLSSRRASSDPYSTRALMYYFLGRIHGYGYAKLNTDDDLAARNEAQFLIEYHKRHFPSIYN